MKMKSLFGSVLLAVILISCKPNQQEKVDNAIAIKEWQKSKEELYSLQQGKKSLDVWARNAANLIEVTEPYFIPYQVIYEVKDKCPQCTKNWERIFSEDFLSRQSPSDDGLNAFSHWKDTSTDAPIISEQWSSFHLDRVKNLKQYLVTSNDRQRDSLLNIYSRSLWLVDRIISPVQGGSNPIVEVCENYDDSLYTKQTNKYIQTFFFLQDRRIPDYAYIGGRGGLLRNKIESQLQQYLVDVDLDGASSLYFEMKRTPIEVMYTNQLSSTRTSEDILRDVTYTNMEVMRLIKNDMYDKAINCTDFDMIYKLIIYSEIINLYDDESQIKIYKRCIKLAGSDKGRLIKIKKLIIGNQAKDRQYSEEFNILIKQIDKKINAN
jgi:hypothetical protein